MEDLLQKVITKVYQLNKNTRHDFFFNFSGHTNTFSIDYCKNGFGVNEKSIYIIDVCTRMTEENLKKALKKSKNTKEAAKLLGISQPTFSRKYNKYKNPNIVAKLVAIVAPAAIHFVEFLDKLAIISTIPIVKKVLQHCSIICDFAVTFIISIPLKYPLNTDAIATKNIAGESVISVIFASGICSKLLDIYVAPKHKINVPVKPIIKNVANDILKILCASLKLPTATFSEINFDIALGTPIEESVKSIAYIW